MARSKWMGVGAACFSVALAAGFIWFKIATEQEAYGGDAGNQNQKAVMSGSKSMGGAPIVPADKQKVIVNSSKSGPMVVQPVNKVSEVTTTPSTTPSTIPTTHADSKPAK